MKALEIEDNEGELSDSSESSFGSQSQSMRSVLSTGESLVLSPEDVLMEASARMKIFPLEFLH